VASVVSALIADTTATCPPAKAASTIAAASTTPTIEAPASRAGQQPAGRQRSNAHLRSERGHTLHQPAHEATRCRADDRSRQQHRTGRERPQTLRGQQHRSREQRRQVGSHHRDTAARDEAEDRPSHHLVGQEAVAVAPGVAHQRGPGE